MTFAPTTLATASRPDDARELLSRGLRAVREGNRVKARFLIRQAVTADPSNAAAWRRLADLVDSPAERADCLRHARTLDPADEDTATPPRPMAAHRCPICRTGWERDERVCPACRSLLALDDPAAFDGPTRCDAQAVTSHLSRLRQAAEADADPAKLSALGLAYLNAGQTSLGMQALTAAALRPETDPRTRERMYRLIERHASGKSTVRMKRREPAPVQPRPLVVVADDSPTMRAVVSAALDAAGYRTVCVCDGSEVDAAIQLEGVPAAVVLDVEMPCVGGFAACKQLRRRPDTRDVPVVFLTGNAGLVSKVRGKTAGGTEYLTKPFVPAALVAVIAKLAPRPAAT
jgi:CheY-like chemotaxis protein